MRSTIVLMTVVFVLIPFCVVGTDDDDCDCELCCDPTFTFVHPDSAPKEYAIPNIGRVKVLVLFAQYEAATWDSFPDSTVYCMSQWGFRDTLPAFASYFITPDTVPNDFEVPSLNDYFWKMSAGTMMVYGDYYPYVVTADSTEAHYDTTGMDDGDVAIQVVGKMAADTQFDFTQFDVNPQDSIIDRVLLVWRKNGSSNAMKWGDDTTIVTWDDIEIPRSSGPKVGSALSFAKGLSTTAHEMLHNFAEAGTLGTYRTEPVVHMNSTWAYGVNSGWDKKGMLMQPFMRYSLNWIEPVDITSDTTDLVISTTSTSGEVIRLFTPGMSEDTSQYFLLDYRHHGGSWYDDTRWNPQRCKNFKGKGLLIWHIDETGDAGHKVPPLHKMVDLESAWGLFDEMPSPHPNPSYGYDWLDIPDRLYDGWTDSIRVSGDSLDFYRPIWSTTFTPYSNPNSNGYYLNRDADPDRWEQTVYTGISVTNVRLGGSTCTLDIHFDTLATSFDSTASHIRHDTNWAKWIILGSDVRIDSGVTVTLSPGAIVSVVPDTDYVATGADTNLVEIIVDGNLVADGSVSDSIMFRPAGMGREYSPEANDWFGIRLEGTGGDVLRYCDVGYGYSGIWLKGQFDDPDSTLINNCLVHDNLYAGIECIQSHAIIESTVIESNGTDGGGSIGLYVYHCNARAFRDTIRGNLPYNYYSICGDVDSGWVARIENCFIAGEGKTADPDAYGICLSRGFADGSIISNTSVIKNSQVGVSLLYDWGLVDIDGCVIKKNYKGILADRKVTQLAGTSYVEVSNSNIKNNTTGVQVSNIPRAYVNLGDTTAGTGGANNLTLNTAHVSNAGGTTQMAEDNWWGGSPPNAGKIVGSWDYNPWRTGAVQMGPRRPRQEGATVSMAYPNPTSGVVAVQLNLPRACHVKFSVYDIAGRLVRVAYNGRADQGTSRLVWNGADGRGNRVGAGIYFCRVESGSESKTTKVVMLR